MAKRARGKTIDMGILDRLRTMLGAGSVPVRLDEPAADGGARPAVAALVAEVERTIAPRLRDGCSDTYLEAVLDVSQLDPCVELLSSVLGAPPKPFGLRTAFDDETSAMVASRGGIESDQCLFLRRYADGRVAFAALWPWSNGRSITLKIGVYADEVTPSCSAGRDGDD